ncbi:cytochrome C [Geomonas sp. Red32]|uniref:cytochrome C n=1 Tax=Geomonas sp. Red32 TaxID=2912856 RepID=UPI00202CE754|nr:cytochrome C [Geomonas sp. Red32]MCM0083746.1 cytochrome C [Geomonas sp. Red32]
MKKVLATVAAVGCLAAASTALGGLPAGTGVNGSLHDMTVVVGPQADSMARVCVFCHTPHHAQSSDGGYNLPLWNHDIPDVTTYTPYAWATPMNSNNGEFTITDPLAGPSRLCMSCHDGAVAVDEHNSAFGKDASQATTSIANVTTYTNQQGRGALGKDLTQTHPIGFDYVEIAAWRNSNSQNGALDSNHNPTGDTEIVSADKGYALSITVENTTQGKYNYVQRNVGGKRIVDNLYGANIMTCATCHEVHNKENATQDNFTDGPKNLTVSGTTYPMAAPNYFLYAKQSESLICLSCHVK